MTPSPQLTWFTSLVAPSRTSHHSSQTASRGTSPSAASSTTPSGAAAQNTTVDGTAVDGTTNGTYGPLLSISSIAGIVVGVSLVAILGLTGLIWFLVRGRRTQKQELGSAVTHQKSTVSVDGIEVPLKRLADSPGFPFSGSPKASPQVPVSSSAPGPTVPPVLNSVSQSNGQYRPAHALQQPGTETASDGLPPEAGGFEDRGSKRRAVPSSVAHLVEEGMTEEEIRRLEEERKLYDEIERAARK